MLPTTELQRLQEEQHRKEQREYYDGEDVLEDE